MAENNNPYQYGEVRNNQLNELGRISHYDLETDKQALALLHELRLPIQSAIHDTLAQIEQKDFNMLRWNHNLGVRLLPPFIASHPNVFPTGSEEKLRGGEFIFFLVIASTMHELEEKGPVVDPDVLFRDIGVDKYSPEMIKPGWLAMIREGGIFTPFSRMLQKGATDIAITDPKRLDSVRIAEIVDNSYWATSFQRTLANMELNEEPQIIVCPAKHIVRNFFAPNLLLNLALIRRDLSPNIDLLGNDERRHYRALNDMYNQYNNLTRPYRTFMGY